MIKIFILTVMLVVVLVFSMQAYAELYYRGTDSNGNRLIYNSDFNITWYDFASARDTWQNQMDWVANLNVNFASTDYNDWRLPHTPQPDPSCSHQYMSGGYLVSYGTNCTGSEMGHLHTIELGNTAGSAGFTNSGDFKELFQSHYHWSVTDYKNPDTGKAWAFWFDNGIQTSWGKDNLDFYGIAVRDGDVPQQTIEPVKIRRETIDGNTYYLNFYYETLQEAYDDADDEVNPIDGNIIQCRAVLLPDDPIINFDINKSVSIKGGYNDDFTANDGITSINGSIIISDGTITIENGVVEIF